METFGEIAVYNQPARGHKDQFLRVYALIVRVSAIFRDRKITRQFSVRAGAFSENALLNSAVSHAGRV
jgi:hypothetical protein